MRSAVSSQRAIVNSDAIMARSSSPVPPKGPFSLLNGLEQASVDEFVSTFVSALALATKEDRESTAKAIEMLSKFEWSPQTEVAWSIVVKLKSHDFGVILPSLTGLLEVPNLPDANLASLTESLLPGVDTKKLREDLGQAEDRGKLALNAIKDFIASDNFLAPQASELLSVLAGDRNVSDEELALVADTIFTKLSANHSIYYLDGDHDYQIPLAQALAQRPWSKTLEQTWNHLFGDNGHLVISNEPTAKVFAIYAETPGLSGQAAVKVFKTLTSYSWSKEPFLAEARRISANPYKNQVSLALAFETDKLKQLIPDLDAVITDAQRTEELNAQMLSARLSNTDPIASELPTFFKLLKSSTNSTVLSEVLEDTFGDEVAETIPELIAALKIIDTEFNSPEDVYAELIEAEEVLPAAQKALVLDLLLRVESSNELSEKVATSALELAWLIPTREIESRVQEKFDPISLTLLTRIVESQKIPDKTVDDFFYELVVQFENEPKEFAALAGILAKRPRSNELTRAWKSLVYGSNKTYTETEVIANLKEFYNTSQIPAQLVDAMFSAALNERNTANVQKEIVDLVVAQPYNSAGFAFAEKIIRSEFPRDIAKLTKIEGLPPSVGRKLADSLLSTSYETFSLALSKAAAESRSLDHADTGLFQARLRATIGNINVDQRTELLNWVSDQGKLPKTPAVFIERILKADNLSTKAALKVVRFLLRENHISSTELLEALVAVGYKAEYRTLFAEFFNGSLERSDQEFRVVTRLQDVPNIPPKIIAAAFYVRLSNSHSGDHMLSLAYELAKQPWSKHTKKCWQLVFEARSITDYGKSLVIEKLSRVDNIGCKQINDLVRRIPRIGSTYQLALGQAIAAMRLPYNGEEHNRLTSFLHVGLLNEDKELTESLRHRSLRAKDKFFIHRPTGTEKIVYAFGAVCQSEAGRRGLKALANSSDFPLLVSQLLARDLSLDSRASTDFLKRLADEAIEIGAKGGLSASQYFPHDMVVYPSSSLSVSSLDLPRHIANSRMVIIGDGPAAILMGVLRRRMGYYPDSTIIIGNSEDLGGIWRQGNVVNEGHNTFRDVQTFGHELRAHEPRAGEDLTRYLNGLIQQFDLEYRHTRGRAKAVEFNPETGKYEVSVSLYQSDEITISADSILTATGNSIPKPLDGGIMATNAPEFRRQLKMQRWQQQIPEDKYAEFDGKSPLVVGLGNSAIAMIHEFIKMKQAGIDVKPVILTHYSKLALKNPSKIVKTADGEVQGPLFRGIHNLSKIAGDIPRLKERYDFALKEGWIIPDVKGYYFRENFFDDLVVDVETKNAKDFTVYNLGPSYGLIGYQNKPSEMEALGLVSDANTGVLDIERITGRAKTRFKDDPGRYYVAGTAASAPGHRSQETIPGMLGVMPIMAFTDLVYATAKGEHFSVS